MTRAGGTHEQEPTSAVTVAELLARNGRAPVAPGGRRRRPDPAPDPAAEPATTAEPAAAAVPTTPAPTTPAPTTGAAKVCAELALAVLAGVLAWLVFRWLWQTWPLAAVGLAAVATTGTVLVVRLGHRGEDLMSTPLSIVVGLVVTMSPALVTLAGG
ncbi:hypothetical protein [Rhodococcus sp. X156]|uniref:hypothetical protein n=1 Tax=Rhodococcus sp. X156 TaxID=2499145 RepID=UPI000FDB2426|nr:hypothetical protein [Rhodococcus sp. X156]